MREVLAGLAKRRLVGVTAARFAEEPVLVLNGPRTACGRHPVPQRTVQPGEPAAVGRQRVFVGHDFSAPPCGRAVWRFPDAILIRHF